MNEQDLKLDVGIKQDIADALCPVIEKHCLDSLTLVWYLNSLCTHMLQKEMETGK